MALLPSQTYLRVVIQRLASHPADKLHHIVPELTTSITECKPIFAAAQDDSEAGVLVHKFRTSLSTLLQNRFPLTRFAAVSLIKATIEAGGFSILQEVGTWIKGLLILLGRAETPVTKTLCILVLQRIFLHIRGHPTLVREISTPHLKPFITTCLAHAMTPMTPRSAAEFASDRSHYLHASLEAFSELLPLHPNLFRPFVDEIKDLVLPLIAPTPSNRNLESHLYVESEGTIAFARSVYALLYVCAPKPKANDERVKMLNDVIRSAERTADRILRVIKEDSRFTSGQNASAHLALDSIVGDPKPQPLNLPGWTGIYSGIERLMGLLATIRIFITIPTPYAVLIPAASIFNLVERLLCALRPTHLAGPKLKPEIDRHEREGLAVGLPRIHAIAIDISTCLLIRLDINYTAATVKHVRQVLCLLDVEFTEVVTRKAVYGFLKEVMSRFGPVLPSSQKAPIEAAIKICLRDVPPSMAMYAHETRAPAKAPATDTDSYLQPNKDSAERSTNPTDLSLAAQGLLQLSTSRLPSGFISAASRTQIDRNMILTGDQQGMLTSAMNTSSSGHQSSASVLPLLARSNDAAIDSVEALIRPQMPSVQLNGSDLAVHGAEYSPPIALPPPAKRSIGAESPPAEAKKPRLDDTGAEPMGDEEMSGGADAPVVAGFLGAALPETTAQNAADVVGQREEEAMASDESDFVMPTLYLDDSSEEEEGAGA